MAVLDAHGSIDAVWKIESTRIIAGLTRIVRDVGLAEELAQDALVAALEQWPSQGVPDNPGAWLMTIAKRRAVDHLRRTERQDHTTARIAHELRHRGQDDATDDDLLRLIFLSCHPVLPTEARTALTLRLLGGLTTQEIARAFLISKQAAAERVADAKRTLAERRVDLELPPPHELAARLASVLEVIYLIFNEGYAATSGDDLMRPSLCHEALRLGRLLANLAPQEAEVHGLVALMEIQSSRQAARTGPSGEPILLHRQDRRHWDPVYIRRGFAAMLRAREIGGTPGPYVLQGAIAVCHAQARTAEDTDWAQIATLYGALVKLVPSPVVRLNRAVAVGMAAGPEAGLELIDALAVDPTLKDYHLLSGVRGDLLSKLGRHDEARTAFERAAALSRNAAERAFLLRRAAEQPTAPRGGARTLADAARDFLARDDLSAETIRSYGQTFRRLCLDLGEGTPVAEVTAERVLQVFMAAWGRASAKTWNRHRAAVRSFSTWAAMDDLSARLDRRPETRELLPAIAPPDLELLWNRPDVAPREKALWRLLHESAASAKAALSLNVEDLQLDDRRGRVPTKAGSGWLTWGPGTSRLLRDLVRDRTRGPLFLADRRPVPARMPKPSDVCPHTGRGRLSYERAEYLFKQATKPLDPSGKGYTLRRLSG